MADLPDFPDLLASTERKLQLRQETRLKKHGLTGAHLHWHEQELERRSRAAAQGSGGRLDECEADEVGIYPSVTVAEARFNDLVVEYWHRWLSSDVGHEVFAVWLEKIKERVSSEDAARWRGHSEFHDRWHERAGGPAVEKALAALVQEGTDRAIGAEEKRLDSTEELERLEKRLRPGPQPADPLTQWMSDVLADLRQEKPWSPAAAPRTASSAPPPVAEGASPQPAAAPTAAVSSLETPSPPTPPASVSPAAPPLPIAEVPEPDAAEGPPNPPAPTRNKLGKPPADFGKTLEEIQAVAATMDKPLPHDVARQVWGAEYNNLTSEEKTPRRAQCRYVLKCMEQNSGKSGKS